MCACVCVCTCVCVCVCVHACACVCVCVCVVIVGTCKAGYGLLFFFLKWGGVLEDWSEMCSRLILCVFWGHCIHCFC